MSSKPAFFTILLCAALVSATAGNAHASHFRGATFSWQRTGDFSVRFTSVQEWKADDVDTLPINPGDGDPALIGPVTTLATGTDLDGEAFRIVTYSVDHTYLTAGPFVAFVGSLSDSINCCRLDSPINSGDDEYRIEGTVDLRDLGNGSPVVGIPPVAVNPKILRLPTGTTGASIDLTPGISDPNGDSFTCELATTSQSGMFENPVAGGHALSITPACELEWNTTGTTIGQKYTVQVEILENRINSNRVAVDFILEIIAATCGDGADNQVSEECDGGDADDCLGAPCLSNCQCAVCGDDSINQVTEECDGTAGGVLGPCPDECRDGPGAGACQCRECGDGLLDPGELCDGTSGACPGACKSDCTCGVCGDNDKNTPTEQCDGIDDSDCPGYCRPAATIGECACAICSDNIRDAGAGEQCDGTDDDDCPGLCTGSCTCPTCGDGVKQGVEGCDDTDDDDCPGACGAPLGDLPCQCPVCGDNEVTSGEDCDGTNDSACDGLCQSPLSDNPCKCATCGDGDVNQLSEVCDGDDDAFCPGDCLADCTCATCGNDVKQSPVEECDGTDDDACSGLCLSAPSPNQCQCPACGDGEANNGEQCDGLDAIACPGLCLPANGPNPCKCPICGDGDVNQGSEDCDGADDSECPGGCLGDCTCPVCGDSVIEGSEECEVGNDLACVGLCLPVDDVNECRCAVCGDNDVNTLAEECDGTDDGDCSGNCTSTCTCAVCGDNIAESPVETCDGDDDDDCPGLCLPQGDANECHCPACGDGVVNQLSEQCDNGIANSDVLAGACRTNCQLSSCGDGVIDLGEECDLGAVSEFCGNRADDDADDAIDCSDSNCGTTCVRANETTFNLPGPAQCTTHAECRAVDSTAHCGSASSCSATCDVERVCEPALRDPSVIRFSNNGPDHFRMLVVFAPQADSSPASESLSLLLTNSNGIVYQATLLPGDLIDRSVRSRRFSFLDPLAPAGNGVRDGLYRVAVRFRKVHRVPVIALRIQAFGDFSAATLAHMTMQVSIGNNGTFVDTDWRQTAAGWRLTAQEFPGVGD